MKTTLYELDNEDYTVQTGQLRLHCTNWTIKTTLYKLDNGRLHCTNWTMKTTLYKLDNEDYTVQTAEIAEKDLVHDNRLSLLFVASS